MIGFEANGLLKPGWYNLQVGAPSSSFLKRVAELLETASKQLQSKPRFEEALQYGCKAGNTQIRQEIANFLSRQYQSPVDWEDIFVTNGASCGLEVLLRQFFTPDQIIFTENPTYPVFATKLKQTNLMTGVPIPLQSDGLDMEYFERELEKLPNDFNLTKNCPFRAAVYLIPTHHNPTGYCYSPEKCKQLVKLARIYDFLIICDDVYNVLSYKEDEKNVGKFLPSPQRLHSYDNKSDPDYKGNVVSNGSFAKIVVPGLRMGWYEAPKHIIDTLRTRSMTYSVTGQSVYVSHILVEALRNESIDEYVESLKAAHKERTTIVIKVIEKNLSKFGVTISHPSGGSFLWVKLPANVDSAKVLELSSKEKVTFVKGNLASLCGDFSNCIRLSISY